jgi:uncharacterized protein with ATP-grasp and redox domains
MEIQFNRGAVIIQDAIETDLDTCATLVNNGSQASGTTIHSSCSQEFLKQFENAPMIIVKGQLAVSWSIKAYSKRMRLWYLCD